MSLYDKIKSGEAKISLVGLGYVGMPLAVAFAAKGVQADRVLPGSSMQPDMALARELAGVLIDMYVTDQVNEVYIIYTPFTKGERAPVCFRLLPLLPASVWGRLSDRWGKRGSAWAADLQIPAAWAVRSFPSFRRRS